jgi:hypothetical protein
MRILLLSVTLLALAALVVLPAPLAEAAADRLLTTQFCEGGRVKVTFSWTGGNSAALEQWLDLTIFNNGWLDGTFIFAGPMNGGVSTYTWEGLTPATQHYVRVNQQLPNRSWDPSQTFPFMTTACAGTPAAVPATAPGGVALTLLGFSTSYSGGSPPPDIILPGSSRLACNPLNLFAFIRVDSLAETTQLYPWWLTNSTPLNRAPIIVTPGTPMFVAVYSPETLSTLPSVRYTLRLSTTLNGPPVLEGGFTTTC